MKFRFFLIFLLVIYFNQSQAGDKEKLSLELIGKKHFDAEPRDIISSVYRIVNNTKTNQKYSIKVTLPPNWKVINPEESFEIARHQQNIRFFSVFIPSTTTSGNYLITYQISSLSVPTLVGSFTVSVFVKPVKKISMFLIDEPSYVIAGDNYQVKLKLKNESNVSVKTKITVNNVDTLSYFITNDHITLAPNQEEFFTVDIITNKDIENSIIKSLEVIATLIDNNEVQSRALGIMEIIPRNLFAKQEFNTIPVYTTLRYVYQNQGSRLSGMQGEIVGKGFINPTHNNEVNLIIRGPDVYDKSIFGKYDEYVFSNRSDKYAFHIGDRSYSLSTLTQSNRFGRGFEGQIENNNFRLGVYSMQSRFFQPE